MRDTKPVDTGVAEGVEMGDKKSAEMADTELVDIRDEAVRPPGIEEANLDSQLPENWDVVVRLPQVDEPSSD
jgi:hypothetical protein